MQQQLLKQFDDLYLVYAVEYDMQLEFDNTEDMLRFDSIIKEYAKKNEGNEEAEGLIYGSWWQPLYSTARTDMPAEDYHQMYDCVVKMVSIPFIRLHCLRIRIR